MGLAHLLVPDDRADVRKRPARTKGADATEPRLVLEQDARGEMSGSLRFQAFYEGRELL